MGPDPVYDDDAGRENDYGFQSIFVPSYVEDHMIVGEDAGMRKARLDVRHGRPHRAFHLSNLRLDRPARLGVFLREIHQLVAPDQLHGNIIRVPNNDINYWFPKWER